VTAQAALRRDLRIAAQHVAPIRAQFRRERDRLAANPDKDPVRDQEWERVISGLWVATSGLVFAKAVKTLDKTVTPGPAPTYPKFVTAAAAGLAATTRRRIASVRRIEKLRRLPNVSRQLRKLYQLDFVKKRAVRVALDQTLRQTATLEHAAAKVVQTVTGDDILKIWQNMGDNRVRGSHLSVSPVLLDEPFLVGGSELRYPRDPAGPGSETYGCRCWVEHVAA
jgi:hypothetical protein